LVLSCKKRTEISLNEFIVHFKDVTKNLTNAEKAYALFYWMAENIAYDANGYFSGNSDVTPEGVYRNGYSVCSGYARLFKYIGTYIGLNVICV
jgi:transglutaminase/protease-like cytokinesis protein 3